MIKYIRDNFENAKVYQIPKADLIIADIPYNIGKNAYASSREWYADDYLKVESDKADKRFFNTDENFNIENFFKFTIRYLKDEPKKGTGASSVLIFCSFEQIPEIIENNKKAHLLSTFIFNLPFYSLNMSTQRLQSFYKIFIASFNLINIANTTFALSSHCSNYQRHSSPNIW